MQVEQLRSASLKQGLGVSAVLEPAASDPAFQSSDAVLTLSLPYCDKTMVWQVLTDLSAPDAGLDLIPCGEEGAPGNKLDTELLQSAYECCDLTELTAWSAWQLQARGALTALALDLKQLHRKMHVAKLGRCTVDRYTRCLRSRHVS